MGNAISDVLFGDVNPSGRLALTFPNKDNEVGFTQAQYPGVKVSTGLESTYSEKLEIVRNQLCTQLSLRFSSCSSMSRPRPDTRWLCSLRPAGVSLVRLAQGRPEVRLRPRAFVLQLLLQRPGGERDDRQLLGQEHWGCRRHGDRPALPGAPPRPEFFAQALHPQASQCECFVVLR